MNASPDGTFHTQRSVGMHGHDETVVFGCGNNSLKLVFSELWVITALGQRQHPASHGQLNYVAAIFIALSYPFVGIIRPINDAVLWSGVTSQVCFYPVGRVCMAARCRHRLSGSENSRTCNQTLCYRISEGKDGLNITGSQVTHRCKTCVKRTPSINRGSQCDISRVH